MPATLRRLAGPVPHPSPGSVAIAGCDVFDLGRLDAATVDGEQVKAQPGGCHGGWITSRVTGPFKGGPGTIGWRQNGDERPGAQIEDGSAVGGRGRGRELLGNGPISLTTAPHDGGHHGPDAARMHRLSSNQKPTARQETATASW